MTAPTHLSGRHQSARPLDSRPIAVCIGATCGKGSDGKCPKHHPTIYADLAGRHQGRAA